MTHAVDSTQSPASPLRRSEVVTRLVRPGGNSIEVRLEHGVSHVATEYEVVAGVHVIVRVGGKTDERWGLQKEPARAYDEARSIVTYLMNPTAKVWVEPNLRLQNHRDLRWRPETEE